MTPTDRIPVWRSIADSLRHDIGAGAYPPGEKLPTEASLARRFGVNRHTVRRAIADLIEAGVVFSRRGAGTFVTADKTDYPIGRRVRFHHNLDAAGRVPGKVIHDVERRLATADEAEALKIPQGAPVFVADGISLADGTPIAVFRSIFPSEGLPGLPEKLIARGSVTAALKDCGVADYTRLTTRVTSVLADAVQANQLQVRPGAPLTLSIGINVTDTGRPIELGRTWFVGERVTLVFSE